MHTLAPSAKNLTYVQSARWSFRKPQGARQHFFFHHESRRRLNLEVASQANTHKIIIERGTSPDFPILGLRLHAHYHSTPKYMANIVRSAKSGSDRTWKDRARRLQHHDRLRFLERFGNDMLSIPTHHRDLIEYATAGETESEDSY